VTTKLSIAPLLGVGGVGFGTKRATAIARLGSPPRSFKRTSFSSHPIDSWFDGCMQVSYIGDLPIVEFIELAHGPAVEVLLWGIPVFDISSGELLSAPSVVPHWNWACGGPMRMMLFRLRA
jgi:hypothetical protein